MKLILILAVVLISGCTTVMVPDTPKILGITKVPESQFIKRMPNIEAMNVFLQGIQSQCNCNVQLCNERSTWK